MVSETTCPFGYCRPISNQRCRRACYDTEACDTQRARVLAKTQLGARRVEQAMGALKGPWGGGEAYGEQQGIRGGRDQ